MNTDHVKCEIRLEDTNEYRLNPSILKCKFERKFSIKRRYSTLFETGKCNNKESNFERLDLKLKKKICVKRRYSKLFEPEKLIEKL